MTWISRLSRREREVLDIVFALEVATLTEIAAQMESPPTRAALRSTVTILERKGHLVHDPERRGREYVYRPARAREREGRSAWRHVVGTFFGGSVHQALAAWLSDPKDRVSPEELRELEELIRQARRTAAKEEKS
ncbi:MAG TPA: BlaI/MecI/CopY family transcriptional regulator [Verrucomicrobiales bacterium]|nr:BlaI/MecI/CopY family transcriptional regulator [Verrucomicrobiales bacterium]